MTTTERKKTMSTTSVPDEVLEAVQQRLKDLEFELGHAQSRLERAKESRATAETHVDEAFKACGTAEVAIEKVKAYLTAVGGDEA